MMGRCGFIKRNRRKLSTSEGPLKKRLGEFRQMYIDLKLEYQALHEKCPRVGEDHVILAQSNNYVGIEIGYTQL